MKARKRVDKFEKYCVNFNALKIKDRLDTILIDIEDDHDDMNIKSLNGLIRFLNKYDLCEYPSITSDSNCNVHCSWETKQNKVAIVFVDEKTINFLIVGRNQNSNYLSGRSNVPLFGAIVENNYKDVSKILWIDGEG